MGRPGKGQKHIKLVRVNYRFNPATAKALEKAARRKGITLTEYVENAVLTQLKRDGAVTVRLSLD